jgi:hypothetical protein
MQISMSGAGDCSKTGAWGSNWDWTKDWSIDWGKDFDKEWKDNKHDADSMKDRVEDLEDSIRKATNCTTEQQQQQQQQKQLLGNQVSDGSVATLDGQGVPAEKCSAAGVNATELGVGGGAAALPTVGGGRKLAGRVASNLLPSSSSSSTSTSTSSSPVAAAWLAARSAATCSRSATELLLQPLQYKRDQDVDDLPAWLMASTKQPLPAAAAEAGQLVSIAAAAEAGVAVEIYDDSDQDLDDGDVREYSLNDSADLNDDFEWTVDGSAGGRRHLLQVTIPGFINFDVGCWYCYYGKGKYADRFL